MENRKNVNTFFKIVSCLYLIFTLYSFACLFFGDVFGILRSDNPLPFFWIFLCIFSLICLFLNIFRLVKCLKRTLEEEKLYYLKRMQKSILCNTILLIGFALLSATYTKEVSLMILILIILLYIVFFAGYILERIFLPGINQERIEIKRIILGVVVNFIILIIPLILIILNMQFDYAYTFSLGFDYYNISIKYLEKGWYVCQLFEYALCIFSCKCLFQYALVPNENYINKTFIITTILTVGSSVLILIQNLIIFDLNYIGQFFSNFINFHLPTILLLIGLNFIARLQEKSNAFYPLLTRKHRPSKIRKKAKESPKLLNRNQLEDDENFTGFNL